MPVEHRWTVSSALMYKHATKVVIGGGCMHDAIKELCFKAHAETILKEGHRAQYDAITRHVPRQGPEGATREDQAGASDSQARWIRQQPSIAARWSCLATDGARRRCTNSRGYTPAFAASTGDWLFSSMGRIFSVPPWGGKPGGRQASTSGLSARLLPCAAAASLNQLRLPLQFALA